MTRFHLDFCPRASWQSGVDAADQRWTRTPNIFTGTEEQATLECSDLEAAYDRSVTFRAVPIEAQPEDEPGCYCAGCGGDFRAKAGHQLACTCAAASVRWVRPAQKVRAS